MLNIVKIDGEHVLTMASRDRQRTSADLLLNSGANSNQFNIDWLNTSLIASKDGHEKVVELLVNSGADFKRVDKNGWDALMLASKDGHEKVVELLVNSGADFKEVDENGQDALMLASMDGHEKVVELLINSGADFKRVDENGRDALMLASVNGHEKVVQLLINSGADFKRVGKNGWDALMLSSFDGHEKIVELLINSGADFKRVDENGRDALMYASSNGHEKVVELLINSGADFKRVDTDGRDALMYASNKGHEKVVELLINSGADFKQVDENGQDVLMIALMNGHEKVVELLINSGADFKRVDGNGWDALMYASITGHEKVVEFLINSGADFKSVDKDGWDALMHASSNGSHSVVQLLLKEVLLMHEPEQSNDLSPIPFDRKNIMANNNYLRKCLAIYLLDILFQAFENKLYNTMEKISIFFDENCIELNFKFQLKRFCKLILQALKQDEQNDTEAELSDSTVSELYNIEFKNFKKSIDCYVKIVILTHNEQTPSYDDLQEFVSDVMSEFSNMRDFDALHFFICQRCLKTIYSNLNEEDELKFFTLLLDLNYADITLRCLKDENLLDTTAPGFTLSLIRDMLTLLEKGSNESTEFALILAVMDAVKTFTDFLISHKNMQNSQSKWIINQVVIILFNIASRKEAKKLFSVNKTYDVIKNMQFKEEGISMLATLLLLLIEDDSTTDTEAKTTAVQLLPWYPVLTEDLSADDNPDDLILTTQCLRGLCRNKEGSEKIITDKYLNGILKHLINSHNEDLSANVHSILWTAGRTTGILPSTTDIVLSDEFPKRFEIKPMSLGQGGFGSVHLVVDIDQPDDKRFVAKKTIAGPKNQKKLMEGLQSEASILIKLKHKNIVQFHGYQRKENDIILFLEYIKMGTLSTFIKQHTRLNEGLTRQFTIQILEGVKYLHENSILHLDIKGTNILMVDKSNIKLTDFGLSTILNEEGVEAERGTTRYMAPEMINCPDGRIFKHGSSLDIWSVGSTVVEMITGSPPNSTTASAYVLFKIAMLQRPKYELSITASKNLRDFLEKTFTPEAEQRPSAEDLLREDPFITGSL